MNHLAAETFRIRFLGAAETVTGSKYLLTNDKINVLVDCGLFQGLKELRLKNWDRFPINPKQIDAIILTHAHIDHSGYIPRLIKEGFKGKIFCTSATLALCRILLPDTGYLQEEEAEWLNRKKFSKHSPALPLFTEKEAEQSLRQFVAINFDEVFTVADGIRATFKYAGHILGAAIAIVEAGPIKIAFSGDLGRQNDSILFAPVPIPSVDYLVVESTYGNRQHKSINSIDELENVVNEALKTNGVILIPAFAVGRAQSLMYYLSVLRKSGRIPDVPMYLNSPMATKVTNLFREFKKLHKLTDKECDEMNEVVYYIRSVEESKELNEKKGPMIIISASGMATGGRVLHHLKSLAPDPKNTILFVGFQAGGTRGASILAGATEVKIHGAYHAINAEVAVLDSMSAHADGAEIIDWIRNQKSPPRRVFVTHGEPAAADELRRRISEMSEAHVCVPEYGQSFEI